MSISFLTLGQKLSKSDRILHSATKLKHIHTESHTYYMNYKHFIFLSELL